jgi:SNF2 family DNA or RNA helicase
MSSFEGLWTDFSYKSHQITGVEWMLQRESAEHPGGLLCDEMGLGKTIEVLGCIVNNSVRNTLLLCPKAVISQWVDAAIRSSLNVCLYRKGKKAGIWNPPEDYFPDRPFLFITNYEKLLSKKNEQMFRLRSWNRLVMDEAHRSKSSSIRKQLLTIQRDITWCVTATPIINQLKDIKTLFQYVGYEPKEIQTKKNLQAAVREACLYRSMAEMRAVLPELPAAPNVRKEELAFETPEEEEFYRGIQGMTVRAWKATKHENGVSRLALLMRLRQISVHPQVYIQSLKMKYTGMYKRDDWTTPSTKFNFIRGKIESAAKPAKWIIFCQFHEEISLLRTFLSSSLAVRNIYEYHGKMTMEEKDDIIKETFTPLNPEDGRSDILLLQLQSGGVGLNLQHFSKIIFVSPWWTNALMEQAIGRAVRIGQKEEVDVTVLSFKGEGWEEECLNIDERMLERGFEKRAMMEELFEVACRGGLMPTIASAYEKTDEVKEDVEQDPIAI